jgi:hypothetical protein
MEVGQMAVDDTSTAVLVVMVNAAEEQVNTNFPPPFLPPCVSFSL